MVLSNIKVNGEQLALQKTGINKLNIKINSSKLFDKKSKSNLISMKRTHSILLLLLATILSPPSMFAETQVVQMLEGEARIGFSIPVGGYHEGKTDLGLIQGIEGRFNFKGTPWDCGIMMTLATAKRTFDIYPDLPPDCTWQNNRTLSIAATGGYNFRQGRKINPFAGIALGVAFNDVVGDEVYPVKGTSMLFCPRVGVELLYHIRLMAELNISRKGFNNAAISIGFVLGGRPKHKKYNKNNITNQQTN